MTEISRLRQVSKSQFKAHALELFREIEASGQTLVVTDHGRPTQEIRPYRPADLLGGRADPKGRRREQKSPGGTRAAQDKWTRRRKRCLQPCSAECAGAGGG
jgi:antitoxin (DNA-binding transcriptional repressor) of toxin-antitoxin stability system